MIEFSPKKIATQALDIIWRHKAFIWLSLFFGLLSAAQVFIDPEQITTSTDITKLVVLAILGIVSVIYVGGIARGSVISEGLLFDNKYSANIKRGLSNGWQYSWRIFGLNLATLISLAFVGAVLFIPVWNLWQMNLNTEGLAMTALAIVIVLPLIVIAGLVNILASIFLISANMPLSQAIKAGSDLFFARWKDCLRLFFLLTVLTILANLVFEIVVSMLGLSELKVVLALLTLAFSSFIAAWQTVSWVLAWQKMVGREKAEKIEFREESEALPEIVA